ncbi:MAG: lipid-A-disaccharide synthase [Bacteroidales bacterium]|nr:lipid-A-disaccharide synthase [Bacteroidales bacterium]
MKYYLIAGEASGDLHASNLMKALKRRDPQAEFRFWGGDLMAAEGGAPVKHYKDISFMGFWEVFVHLKTILGLLRFCKEDILRYAPDALVLVDYPGFNLRVAKFAKQHQIPVFYYISPQIWAWKKGRIRTIKKNVDEMMVILPFEEAFYAKNGMKVHYVGHPLLDAVTHEVRESEEVRDFRTDNRLDEREIIALLPGSRKQEISALLPQMLTLVPLFPQYQFVVSTVNWQPASLYDQFINDAPVTRVSGSVYPLLANAKAAVVTSGTATLETALFGVPQVVCYAGSEVSYIIAKQLVKGISYISLPNLIADKPIVKELIQHDFDTRHLKEELFKITEDKENVERMKKDYDTLCQQLGNGSASEKAASVITDFFDGKVV